MRLGHAMGWTCRVFLAERAFRERAVRAFGLRRGDLGIECGPRGIGRSRAAQLLGIEGLDCVLAVQAGDEHRDRIAFERAEFAELGRREQRTSLFCACSRATGRRVRRTQSRCEPGAMPAGRRACAEELRVAVFAGRVRRIRPARALCGRGVHRRLDGQDAIKAFYAEKLRSSGCDRCHAGRTRCRDRRGEDPRPVRRVPERPAQQGGHGRSSPSRRRGASRSAERLLEHVHMLVLHPRDADARSLQALFDAGWTTTEVVTLSQLVAFLSFPDPTVAGLKA